VVTGTNLPWAIIHILNKTTYSMTQFKSQGLIFLILIHLKLLKLTIYFSKLQCTSPQSISVAYFGCRINHMKHLISWLQKIYIYIYIYILILVWQGGAAVGCLTVLSKGEIAPFHTMKVYRGRRIIAPLILNLSVRWR